MFQALNASSFDFLHEVGRRLTASSGDRLETDLFVVSVPFSSYSALDSGIFHFH